MRTQITRLRPRDLPLTEMALGLVVITVLARRRIAPAFQSPAVSHWATVFIAVCTQAMPFLVLGVSLSGLIAGYVRPATLARILPTRTALAVPLAAIGGAVLPGCECSSVPVAARLAERGVAFPAALAFLLASPAINPVVLVATAVAFPHQPRFVVARFVASVITATVVGWIWIRVGKTEWLNKELNRHQHHHDASSWSVATSTALHDFLQAGGYLVLGAATAATLQTAVPRTVLDRVAGSGPLAVVALGLLAVILSICSEADAFVATGFTQFSPTARLAFLVVGPMVDIKLIALQTGTFGRRFAQRFAPLTFVVAIAVSAVVGLGLR